MVDDDLEKIIRQGKKLIKKYFDDIDIPYLNTNEKLVINNGLHTFAILKALKSSDEITGTNSDEIIFKVLRVLNYS